MTTDTLPVPLNFRISAGLKRIIGRDLIVSDFVAVFELVKNSFDAHAEHVLIMFEDDCIWVIDDGKGMSYQDLLEKWLFVAYSAKRDGTEDNDYRGGKHSSGAFAGNKGVGRFSCDRLGAQLQIQSRADSAGRVEILNVDWSRFESDDKDEFVDIDVTHSFAGDFELPKDAGLPGRGTALRISGLHEPWDRTKLLDLKAHLTKLINPFDGLDSAFTVFIRCDVEKSNDEELTPALENIDEADIASINRKVVNGPIQNFIFNDLAAKTTLIDVRFSADGSALLTDLIDRGKLIYSVSEPNPYQRLEEGKFSCRLFYLNMSAKQTFSRRMGIPVVQFGSVFLFRNGFRVFPVGNEGDDTFGIDRRKQQGFSRYLGTRDLIGRIDVHGDETLFREASSRDQGLVETPASIEMKDCFWEKCLKRLEKYVVGVTWQDKLDKDRSDASGLESAPARARIIEVVSDLVNGNDITLLDYSQDLIDILSDKVEQFEESLSDLKLFARATGDTSLEKRIVRAERRYQELKEAEARAREIAEAERVAREQAEAKARAAEEAKGKAEKELEEERKRTLFLTSVSSLDVETVTNLHHQVVICSVDIHELIEAQIEKINAGGKIDRDTLFSFLEQMRLKNQQVLAIARMATKANFRMDSDVINDDLAAYMSQYAKNIASVAHDRIAIEVQDPPKSFVRDFKPIEIAIVIDNIISNARKAKSPKVRITFDWPSAKTMTIIFTDFGKGLDARFTDPSRIFEKGVSTTDGSGLGLYHVKQLIDGMGGQILYRAPAHRGAEFEITFPQS
ncbi:MAG: ATP-binding protein [Sulfuritalea sp.]|nr:ATP-binding protein [Sulfuritalea sp.]